MAESVAVVDDEVRSPAPAAASIFFCHSCGVEIERVTEAFTCLLCGKGFIEEMPLATEETGAGPDNVTVHPDPDVEMHDDDRSVFHSFLPQSYNTRLSEEISSLLMSVTGAQPSHDGAGASGSSASTSSSSAYPPPPYNTMFDLHRLGLHTPHGVQPVAGGSHTASSSNSASHSSNNSNSAAGPSGSHIGYTWGVGPRQMPVAAGRRPPGAALPATTSRSRHQPPAELHQIDHIVQEFLVSVTGGAANGPGGSGAAPMYFMSNPADYVYGRDGLDTIVTQLLNQMDGTGPPPLATGQIDDIPHVAVTAEQVEEKLQCSVCWEDFVLAERVRRLSCLHIFHENCIVPWLQLHATCPVCRKVLNSENAEERQQSVVHDVTQSLRSVAAMYQAPAGGGSAASSAAATSSTASGSGGAARRAPSRNPQRTHRYTQRLNPSSNVGEMPMFMLPSILRRPGNGDPVAALAVAGPSQPRRRLSDPESRAPRRDEDGNVDFEYD